MANHRLFIRRNLTSVSIFLFVLVFGMIYHIKPGFLFNEHGSLREFGLGYKKKNNYTNMVCYIYFSYFFLFVCFILFSNP